MYIGKNSCIQSGNGYYNNSSKRKVNYMLLSYFFKITIGCRIEMVLSLFFYTQMSSSGVCRTYVIYIFICCFCLYVCIIKQNDGIICNLYSLLSLSFSWVLLLFYYWMKGIEKRERENSTIFTLSFFLRVRPFCPSFKRYKKYLYT